MGWTAPPPDGGGGHIVAGIDVGSSSLKALLLDEAGRWVLGRSTLRLVDQPGGQSGVVDPAALCEAVWTAVRDLLVCAPWPAERISAVAITSHGPSALIVDVEGQPLGPMITWRAPMPPHLVEEQAARWPAAAEGPGYGLRLAPRGSWPPARLAQWLENERLKPDGPLRAVQLKDLLAAQVGASLAADRRSQRGLVAADGGVHTAWRDLIGPNLETAPLHAVGAAIGRVDEAGAARSGLPAGTEVKMGSCDLSCGALGLALEPGDRFILANTSEHVGVALPSDRAPADLPWPPGASLLPADGPLLPLLYGGVSSGGATLMAVQAALHAADPDSVPSVADPAASLQWWITLTRDGPLASRLPPFWPELGGRRGLDPRPDRPGGWDDAGLSRTTDLVHRHGLGAVLRTVLASLDAPLQQVDDVLQPFAGSDQPVRMGGGFVDLVPLVEQRRSRWPTLAVSAGAEVSALGAARLARFGTVGP